jgi:hypothetical protein
MTSTHTRRSFTGNNPKTQPHSRSSSSTTTSLETPSETSPSSSPHFDMPPRLNGAVNNLAEDMAAAKFNGSKKSKRAPMDRKQSSPMMPAFMVSAPGKVIVFGEHAVVHGKVCEIYCALAKLLLTLNCRLPSQHLFPYAHTSSSPPFLNRNVQSLFDSPISTLRILGTLMTCHGTYFLRHRKRSTTTTLLLLSTPNWLLQ